MNCFFHADQDISCICISQHKCQKCQRKLFCQYLKEHKFDIKLTIQPKFFFKKVIERMEGFMLGDKNLKLTKQLMDFNQYMDTVRTKIEEQYKQLSSHIKFFYDKIKQQQGMWYTYFLDKNHNLAEFSQKDLEELVQIFNGTTLDIQDGQKKSYANQMSSIKNQLVQDINIFCNKVKECIKEISLILNQLINQNIYRTKKPIFKSNLGTKEINSLIWDYSQNKFVRTQFTIAFTDKHEVQYIKDGQIIRIDKVKDISIQPQVMQSLEQIINLYWSGSYGQNNQKIGRWKAIWKGQNLGNVGGEYIDGKKSGKWKDLIQNYWSLSKVYEFGQYKNDIRKGAWECVYENDKIGGGEYNDDGVKQGKWIDIFENFSESAQITYNGEYNIRGMKVDRWDIMYCDPNGDGKYKQIGGGSYDQEGNQKKIGKWVELDEGFRDIVQVTYHGEYNMNNMKVGRWDIMYNMYRDGELEQIGGGSYDQDGNQKKIGKWVELDEGFNTLKQVTYKGEYNTSGMKVGRWDTIYFKCNKGGYHQIGGGSYDQDGNQKKIGKWVELDEGFNTLKQVTYKGEYNTSGTKVGRWDIMYFKCNKGGYNQIGGGSYDQEGNQKKIGKWVELDERCNFMQQDYWDIKNYKSDQEKFKQIENIQEMMNYMINRVKWLEGCEDDYYVLQTGDYNGKGNKIGRWNFIWRKKGENEFTIVGGGFYQEYEDCSKKQGDWVEMRNGFSQSCQVTYSGQYCNNSKIQRWDTYFEDKIIGGGSYDSQSLKNGVWIDLCDNFHQYNKVASKGQYQNGKKIGQWEQFEIVKTNCSVEFKQIGEHYYNGEYIY